MKCPQCRKEAVAEFSPFCSKRCADVDLARWLRGDYAIPGRDGEAADDLAQDADRDPHHPRG